MTDPTNDIDDLMCWLSAPPRHDWDEKPSEHDRYYLALAALVAERDGLLRRNAAFVACDGQYAKALAAVEADRNALVAERNGLRAELERMLGEVKP